MLAVLLNAGCTTLFGIGDIDVGPDASQIALDASDTADAMAALGSWEPVTLGAAESVIRDVAVATKTSGFEAFGQAGANVLIHPLSTNLEGISSEAINSLLIDIARPLRDGKALIQQQDGTLRLGDQIFPTPSSISARPTIQASTNANETEIVGEVGVDAFEMFTCQSNCPSSSGVLGAVEAHDLNIFGNAVFAVLSDQFGGGGADRVVLAGRQGTVALCVVGLGKTSRIAGSGDLGLIAWKNNGLNAVSFNRVDTDDLVESCTENAPVAVAGSGEPLALAELARGDFVSAFVFGESIRVVRITVAAPAGSIPVIETIAEIEAMADTIAIAATDAFDGEGNNEPIAIVVWSDGNQLLAARGPLRPNPLH